MRKMGWCAGAVLPLLFALGTGNAQWVQPSGPGSAAVNFLQEDGSTLWAGLTRGLYRTEDSGRTWIHSAGELDSAYMADLLVAGGTRYAAADKGMFRSGDGGRTWAKLKGPTISDPSRYYIMEVDQVGTTLVAALSGGGIFRSRDGGETWEGPTQNHFNVGDMVACEENILVSISGAVYLSEDAGVTWNQLPELGASAFRLAGGRLMYARYGSTQFVSEDCGKTWTDQEFTHLLSFGHMVAHGTLLFGMHSYEGVARSDDQGRTWTQYSNPLPGLLRDLAFIGPWMFVGAFEGGVFRSADSGQTWQATTHGLPRASIPAMASLGTHCVAGTPQKGAYRSLDGGATWLPSNRGLDLVRPEALPLLADGTTLWAAAGGLHHLLRSLDSGKTWGFTTTDLDRAKVLSMVRAGGSLYVGAAGSGLLPWAGGAYRSSDNGLTWVQINQGLPITDGVALAAQSDTVYLGTGSAGVFRNVGDDAWTPHSQGLADTAITDLAVLGRHVVAATRKGVFRSDGGEPWTAMNSGLAESYVHVLEVIDGRLFGGSIDGRVYRFSESDGAWIPLRDDSFDALQPRPGIRSLAACGDHLLIGTWLGIWRRPLASALGARPRPEAERTLLPPGRLRRGVPFQLQLPAAGVIALELWLPGGRKAATLLRGRLGAGEHPVTVPPGLARGVYLMRLQTDGPASVSKILLD